MPIYTTGRYPNIAAAGVQEYSVALTAATTTTAGAVAAIANPLGVDLIIVDAFVRVTTPATTPTNTIDIGIAANGTTSNDTLFDGLTTGVGVRDARKSADYGTNGGVARVLTSTQYVTATASATLVGMVGTLHLVYVRA
jgi:hypothetical protein